MTVRPNNLIQNYWAACESRGEKPKPVYCLVSIGGEQPTGYVKAWSIRRKQVESWRERELQPEFWHVEKVTRP